MNQAKRSLISTIFLASIAIFLAWTNPIDTGIAIAQTNLIPSPSLQEERAETPTSNKMDLPPEVQSAVLEDAARRSSQTVSALRILDAKPETWTDGCLGLAEPDRLCTQVMTPGWQVIVTDGQKNWTYRTDRSGNLVKLEKAPQDKH